MSTAQYRQTYNGQTMSDELIIKIFSEQKQYPQEVLSDVIRRVLKEEVDIDFQFDMIELAFSQKQVQYVTFDPNELGSLVRLCKNVLQLAALYKQKQLALSSSNKTIRDKLRDIIDFDRLYEQLYIDQCFQCDRQDQLNQLKKRMSAILILLLDFSEDMTGFYYVFEVLVKALCLIFNFNNISNQTDVDQMVDLIKKLIVSIGKEQNIFYWQTLFDMIFEISRYETNKDQLIQPSLVTFYIIKEIPQEHIKKIMIYLGQYLIKIKSLNQKDQALQIIRSLVLSQSGYGDGLNKSNLNLIIGICESLKTNIELQKDYLVVLQELHSQFACKVLINNLQRLGTFDEILQLITFFFIGVSQIKAQRFDDNALIVRMVNKLECMRERLSKQEQRNTLLFLSQMIKSYNDVMSIKQFETLFNTLKKELSYTPNQSDLRLSDLTWASSNNQVAEKNQKSKNKLIGIRNINNTCYFNSFIQGIFMTTEFKNIILDFQIKPDQSIKQYLCKSESTDFLLQLKKVFSFLEYVNEDFDLCPVLFKQSLREPYRSQYSQQDAGEFGTQFFEDLEQSMGPKFKLVKDLFIGQIKYLFACQKCNKTTRGQSEDFLQLTLNFPQPGSESYIGSRTQFRVQDLLKRHISPESLDMTCDHCQTRGRCTKSISFEYLPKCLIIMLNRFQYQQNEKTKILSTVNLDFEIQIKAAERICTYKLYAFIVHLGDNADAGHYITYAKQEGSDYWILFDDSEASVQRDLRTEQDLLNKCFHSSTPYILFYKQD